ncbi:MAG: isoaspartyl peptidase/L-asparaginase family protein [Terriglobales bacterium]
MTRAEISIALHGGSGAKPGHDYGSVTRHMRGLIELGQERLQRGIPAVEVAVEIVAALESSGLYIAGRGASPNLDGDYELDACVMDGSSGSAGAVAALTGFANPIRAAAAVMRKTPHVLLVGSGAAQFARQQRLEATPAHSAWYTNACSFEAVPAAESHGTVGCVTRDVRGNLAAATSTGGAFGKLPGRVGDSALIGASTWADRNLAVSCTGHGEAFIRAAAAAQVAHRVRFGAQTLEAAATAVIEEIAAQGGHGGLIAIDSSGNVTMPFRSSGMKRAALLNDGTILSLAP